MDESKSAITEIFDLLGQQGQALIDGDTGYSRFDLLLDVAREREHTAKSALIAHIESRDCEAG